MSTFSSFVVPNMYSPNMNVPFQWRNFKKTEICCIKMLKTIQLPLSNYLLTYYQTLYEVIWLEKLNKRNVELKNLKVLSENFQNPKS